MVVSLRRLIHAFADWFEAGAEKFRAGVERDWLAAYAEGYEDGLNNG